MADRSAIEWTDATWNPIRARNRATGQVGWYCEHASTGCLNCYSEDFNANRLGTRLPFKPGHRRDVEIYLDETVLLHPLRWRRPRKIFPCSMTDLFGSWVPDAWLDRIFAVMALCPQHTFQPLSKRAARQRAYLTHPLVKTRIARAMTAIGPCGLYRHLGTAIAERAYCIETCFLWPLPNVWSGISAENQIAANERVPELMATPATVRWVSAEPLLEYIDFGVADGGESAFVRECWGDCRGCSDGRPPAVGCRRYHDAAKQVHGLDWVVVGDESGRHRRAVDLDAVREIRDQCAAAGTPFFLKQLHIDGRKVGLPELDGRTWAEMPGVPA